MWFNQACHGSAIAPTARLIVWQEYGTFNGGHFSKQNFWQWTHKDNINGRIFNTELFDTSKGLSVPKILFIPYVVQFLHLFISVK